MNSPETTQHSGPEMSAASNPSTAGATQLFQPLELPTAEPFRISKSFAIAKLALGSLNLALSIVSLALIVAEFTNLQWHFSPPPVLNIYLPLVRPAHGRIVALYFYYKFV